MLRGSLVALATPFRDGELDIPALDRLLEHQLEGGTHAIVAAGTTGESPNLDAMTFAALVTRCKDVIAGRIPLVVGTGTNSTRSSVEKTRQALELGADAALVVTPYYNRPKPDGLIEHFRVVAAEGGLPVVAYNVPSRTSCRPDLETLLAIVALDNVTGLKEATGDLGLAANLAGAITDLPGEPVALLSGDDPTSMPFWAAGGVGVISVTANVDPARCARVWDLLAERKTAAAMTLHQELTPLHQAMGWETNPIPVKEALHILGLIGPELLLPMTRLSEPLRPRMAEVLASLGLLG